MLKEEEINFLRGVSFVFGVLSYLQDDYLCSKCDSFDKSVDTARDKFLAIEKLINGKDMSEEMRKLLSGIYAMLSDLNIPEKPTGQKKIGSCKLPAKVCFPRSALAMYERLSR
jgi:hypothetical protein